jgi:hypothetical protein
VQLALGLDEAAGQPAVVVAEAEASLGEGLAAEVRGVGAAEAV